MVFFAASSLCPILSALYVQWNRKKNSKRQTSQNGCNKKKLKNNDSDGGSDGNSREALQNTTQSDHTKKLYSERGLIFDQLNTFFCHSPVMYFSPNPSCFWLHGFLKPFAHTDQTHKHISFRFHLCDAQSSLHISIVIHQVLRPKLFCYVLTFLMCVL